MKNERTSVAVSKLAGFLMQALQKFEDKQFLCVDGRRVVSVGVVKKICGSSLTQAEDKISDARLIGYASGPLKAKDLADNLLTDRARRILDSLPREIKANPKRKNPARKGRK